MVFEKVERVRVMLHGACHWPALLEEVIPHELQFPKSAPSRGPTTEAYVPRDLRHFPKKCQPWRAQ
jgi:hypothetical protein